MAESISSIDTTSHPVFAIVRMASGRTVRFPKAQPVGWASAAAWQSAAQTEQLNAINNAGTSGRNSLGLLTSLV